MQNEINSSKYTVAVLRVCVWARTISTNQIIIWHVSNEKKQDPEEKMMCIQISISNINSQTFTLLLIPMLFAVRFA